MAFKFISLLVVLPVMAILFSCDEAPTEDDTTSTKSVYDANGDFLGSLENSTTPPFHIKFRDISEGVFNEDGTFFSGVCGGSDEYCTAIPTASGRGLSFRIVTASGIVWDPDGAGETLTRSYCSYTTTDCTGTCYIPGAPQALSIFLTRDGFVQATGSESTVGATINSVWLYDITSCSTLENGTGVCCSSFSGTSPVVSGAGLSGEYTLPVTVPDYPFSGPLTTK